MEAMAASAEEEEATFLIVLSRAWLPGQKEEAALATLGELDHENVGAWQEPLLTRCPFPKSDVGCLQVELAAVATADDRC